MEAVKKDELVEIFELAAQRVANIDNYSCNEVARAAESVLRDRRSWQRYNIVNLYRETMEIDKYAEDSFWCEFNLAERKLPRVLALLLMAEWVKTDYQES